MQRSLSLPISVFQINRALHLCICMVRLADVGKKRITDNAVLPLEWMGLGREAARTNKVTRFSSR